MSTLDDLKSELYDVVIEDSSRDSKYGRFLDKLVFEEDCRGQDKSWDLWYFSDNTDFCRRCARHFAAAIDDQLEEHTAFVHSLGHDGPRDTRFEFEALRRLMGSLFFYQFSALESFAQETNLFYGLGLKRSDVSLVRVGHKIKSVRPRSELARHMEAMEKTDGYVMFRCYRNAVAHGYVFPLQGGYNSILVPVQPKQNPFSFDGIMIDLRELTRKSTSLVDTYICQGWRCFEHDELSPRA